MKKQKKSETKNVESKKKSEAKAMKQEKQEAPKINFPEKLILFLALSLAFLLFLFDIVQNKVIDLGTDYKVTFFGQHSVKASSFLWVAFALLVIFQLILLYRNIWYKAKKHYLDYVFAFLLNAANTLLIIGFVSDFNVGSKIGVGYFFNMVPVSIYHLGIALEIISIFYFAFTK